MCRCLPTLSPNVLISYSKSFTYFRLLVVCAASGMINLQDNDVNTAHLLVKDTHCLYVSPERIVVCIGYDLP
jgi:hypothetical protein